MAVIARVTAAPRIHHHLEGRPLWDWYSIRIEDHEENIKKVFFLSRIHVNKEKEMTFCYSASHFSDHAILYDRTLVSKLIEMYGPDLTRRS